MDFLLEIGLEELPARYLDSAIAQLAARGEEAFREHRIPYAEVRSYGTPRRLVLYVRGVGPTQEVLVEEVKGPPRRAAFDAAGNPTKAALGFARSQGVAVEDLVVRETPGGEYVFAVKHHQGRPTREVLPEILPGVITGISLPRPMRWGRGDLKFARPIRWLLCLLGEEVVPLELNGLRAGRTTYGLRVFAPGPITVETPDDYFEKLRAAYVVVDQEERRARVLQLAQEAAAAVGGKVCPDEELLREVTNLLEYPVVLCGDIPPEFLRLPPEVVITPMQEHQRYFPVWDDAGKLLPKFVAFANGPVGNLGLVRAGNEKVLRARLQDAAFFYDEDRKTPLAAKVEKLGEIVFLEGLGTLREKTERLRELVLYLAGVLGLAPEEREAVLRAAYLAKADLVTSMVYEFPELQGIMGGEYARADGEPEAVCLAIREHYQPRGAGDPPPATRPGAVLALADKMDNLVGCFGLGLEPTGSQDPYALRRQALGICHIVFAHQFDFSLGDFISCSCAAYREARFKRSPEEVRAALLSFFQARLKGLFLEQGVPYDLVDAVLAPGCDALLRTRLRLEALVSFQADPRFDLLLTSYTRAANLARQGSPGEVRPSLFEKEEEHRLYAVWQGAREEIARFSRERDYLKALAAGAVLARPIDDFFREVMVMVEDQALRANRLALLHDIAATLGQLADFSKIVRSE